MAEAAVVAEPACKPGTEEPAADPLSCRFEELGCGACSAAAWTEAWPVERRAVPRGIRQRIRPRHHCRRTALAR